MKKSLFVVALAAASLMAMSTAAFAETAYEETGEAVTLRLGHTQQAEHQVNITAERLAELVSERTNGEITIDIYANSTFGTAADMNAAIQSGDLEMYINATAQFAAQYEPVSVVDAWYLFENTDHLLKFFSPDCEIYVTLMDGLKEACNIDTLASIYYGARQMTANKEINSADDLVGLKMRVAADPMPSACMEALGAIPTPVAYNETYMALQQGTVDGQENPVASIQTMKFDEVQKCLALTYHQYQMLNIFLGTETEAKLTENQIAVIRECAQQAAEEHNAVAIDQEKELIEAEKDVLTVTEPDLTGFMEKCQALYGDFESVWGEGVADAIIALAE